MHKLKVLSTCLTKIYPSTILETRITMRKSSGTRLIWYGVSVCTLGLFGRLKRSHKRLEWHIKRSGIGDKLTKHAEITLRQGYEHTR